MKKSGYAVIAGLALFTLFVFTMAANANTIQGTVISVDPAQHQLVIHPSENEKEVPEKLELVVKTGADLKNIMKLDDLKEGNEVKVKIDENKDNRTWEADKIELVS
jgi:hypothetical protein